MKNKIIIFGGNGVLGSALTKKLLSKKKTSIVVVDKAINKKKNNNKNVSFLKTDIEKVSLKRLEQILKGVSVIYYTISKPGKPLEACNYKKSWDFISINSLGFWKITKVAEKIKIKKLIVASSITAISDLATTGPYYEYTKANKPPNFYALSKAILEDISNYKNSSKNLKILIIRYPRIYYKDKNNFLIKFARQIKFEKNLKIYGNLNKFIDLVHLDDAVEFALKCVDYNKSKNIFHITYNKTLKLKEILFYLSKKINSKNKIRYLRKSLNSPRESDQAFLKDSYSSKKMKVKFKYNTYMLLDDAIDFVLN